MTWIACIMFFLLVISYVKIHLVGGQKWNSTVTFGDKNINQQLFLLKGAFCSDTIYVTLCVPCSVSAQNQMDEGTKNRRQWRGLHSGFFKENVSTHSYTLIHTDWLSWLGIKKITLREKQFNRYCTNLKNPKVFAWFDLLLATALNQFMQINNSPPLHRF